MLSLLRSHRGRRNPEGRRRRAAVSWSPTPELLEGRILLSAKHLVARTPTTVSITAPLNGSTIYDSLISPTTTLTANASGNRGVARVQFRVDGKIIATDKVAPYSASWNTTRLRNNSRHTITAIVTDRASHTASTKRTVTVVHRPPPVTLPPVISPAGQTISVKVTFYGWPDNSPPGNSVAYPTPARPVAGGTGTYADPVSAAVRQGNPLMPVGTILYVPGLKKYAIVDDVCVSCNSNNWVDLWVGGDANSDPAAVRAREDALTGDETVPRLILIHAPAGLPVDSAPLFAPTN
jgi:3D (Asp-Asp-Asp) domain-containing protein